ncbi:MAG: precorrin-2 C(20)-methyltransferase [Clostridia bacterium]|nr:precorrin-2 C(20)-methyltransferase [Clostridia bacterium]
MKGKLYGIGVGPGDPELLTLKGARLLRECPVVAVPDKGAGEKTALNIVKEHVEGKEIVCCPAPMVREAAALERSYNESADKVCECLAQGKDVAFITLGDPTVYSTYIYTHKKVLERGYEAELVPGVPSFCAVAARLGTSLCEGSERLLVVPASHDAVDDCMDFKANKVFMKAGRAIGELRDQLRVKGLIDKASMVANCGMEGEQVYRHFGDMEDGTGYFSVVLVKDGQ